MWGKPVAPVGLFGKLPSHPDFVRLNAGGALPRALDTWFAEGLLEMRRTGAAWEVRFDVSPPIFFIFRGGPGTDVLVGVCRPGRDRSGRRYPFAIFAQETLERGGRGLHLIPVGHTPFLLAASRLATGECADGIDDQRAGRILALTTALPQNPVEVGRRFTDHLRSVTMGSFWRDVFGDTEDPRKYLIIKNLFAALGPWRGADPARMNMIIKFPLSPAATGSFLQTAIWLLLVRAIVGEETLSQAVVFWHDAVGAERMGCYLLLHPPASSVFPMVFVPSGRNDNLWDLAQIGGSDPMAARTALSGDLLVALDSPSYPIQEFIERI
ncbi:MAG: type VI secretion system-associated protein TagF [Candidatus Zixiibacteriota bacterium]